LDTFEAFIDFIYKLDYEASSDSAEIEDRALLHIDVYTFADRLCMPDLKELALQKLANELFQSSIPVADAPRPIDVSVLLDIVGYIWSNTKPTVRQEANGGVVLPTRPANRSQEENGSLIPFERPYMALRKSKLHRQRSGETHEQSLPQKEPEVDRDHMRTLLTKYTASVLSRVRYNPRFAETWREFPEFAADLFDQLPNRQQLSAADLNALKV
jgi:hypothetical protein